MLGTEDGIQVIQGLTFGFFTRNVSVLPHNRLVVFECEDVYSLKPGFHIVVSVVSVVRKKFTGQIKLYGNLPYKCSIQKK